MKKIFWALIGLIVALMSWGNAAAQVSTPGVRQSGAVTTNHIAVFANTTTGGGGGAVKDGGTLAQVFSAIANCTTRGSVLYIGASSNVACLDPTGQNGKFLKSNDAGADPSFASAVGAGTVTSQGATSPGGSISIAASSGANPNTSAANFTFDIATNGVTTGTINAAAVTYAKIQNVAAISLFGRSANTAGVGADVSAVAASSCAFRESASTIGCGTLATAAYANSSVTYAKIQNAGALTLLGNATNAGAALADVSASAASGCAFRESASTIGCGTLATAAYANASVTYAKIQNVGAFSLFGNSTGAGAAGADITIAGLAAKALPTNADTVMCSDAAASNALKKCGFLASLNAKAGALTLSTTVQVFLAAGTYTPTPGTIFSVAECRGNGGGGGGAVGVASQTFAGGGGGQGGYAQAYIASPGVTAVTFGATGTGGATGTNNGVAGGDVALGAICVGKGGSGGLWGGAAQLGRGGPGGVAGTGNITIPGMPGLQGPYAATNLFLGESGAGGGEGGARGAFTAAAATTGIAGTMGGGGSGGHTNNTGSTAAGGDGGTGWVKVTDFVLN